ncbi:MAG: ATP-binding protein, partial [Dehalococcoidia bacterium]
MAGRSNSSLRVPVSKLRRACDASVFKFKTTAEVAPLEGTVGQARAVEAMDFGLSIEAAGFNLFVSGPPGTGRSTELRMQVERIAAGRPAPRDWCYVFNFKDPARPRALSLPPDRGHQLSDDIDELVETVRAEVPKAFESDEYAQRRDQVNREVQAQREQMFGALQKEADARQMAVNATPMGITTVPVVEDKPLTKEQYDQLSEEAKRDVQARTAELDSIIAQFVPQLRRLDRDVAQLLAELDRHVMVAITEPLIDDLKRDYASQRDVTDFLDRVREDMVSNLDAFRSPEEQPQTPIPGLAANLRESVLNRYTVNVIVTHDGEASAPVVFEDSPSYYRMFGRIDYRTSFGSMTTDHTMIKPGALHRANGGFIVVEALDIFTQPLVWETLKRALRTQQLMLENLGEQLSIVPTATLAPEPIPLNVKVAIIGNNRIFTILQSADEDFRKLFKAKADFTIDVARDAQNVQAYARFISKQVSDLGM